MLLWVADLAHAVLRAGVMRRKLSRMRTRSPTSGQGAWASPQVDPEACSPAGFLVPAVCALPWAYSNPIIIKLKRRVLYMLLRPCPQLQTDKLSLACRGPWPLRGGSLPGCFSSRGRAW